VNQCQSPLMRFAGSKLVDVGRSAVHDAERLSTPKPDQITGGEATGEGCGVPVARLQEQSWAPPLSTGS
jgi:hypothetical protein